MKEEVVKEEESQSGEGEGDDTNATKRQKRASTVASYHVELLYVLDHTIWEQ